MNEVTVDIEDRREERDRMVREQIEGRGIADPRVLEAFRRVPRELFVEEGALTAAYRDHPLPIGEEQTISQPYIVALMVEALEPRPDDRALEVGTGSGYAAAILAETVSEVHTIERHGSLAEVAESRLAAGGWTNAEVRHGDGTRGWPDAAPFDLILVSAGGDRIPEALIAQLAPGGRMVIPVGGRLHEQRLLRVTKSEDGERLHRTDLGAVRFVPLVADPDPEPAPAPGPADRMREEAESFDELAAASLPGLTGRLAGHRLVLLGESTHGTSEYYRLRADLTRALIERGEIDFVAVEADWPDAAWIDRRVRGLEPDGVPETPFERFPRWMWANEEVRDFLVWLREWNLEIEDPSERVGFHGLDLYALHTSIEAVLARLEDRDPELAALAAERFGCLEPWARNPAQYGRLVEHRGLAACEDDVVAVLEELLSRRLDHAPDGEAWFDAVQNARLVRGAERYYRAMYRGPTASWNLRDTHMTDTLGALLDHYGEDSAGAVWAHNSHLGDARASEMGDEGRTNVGRLCRERWGEHCRLVGFGSNRGEVLAAEDWDAPGRVRTLRPALEGSWERLSHQAGPPAFALPLDRSTGLRDALAEPRLERAVGVVYRPETERWSHYFQAVLPDRFDEWVFLERTSAVTPLLPLTGPSGDEGPAETWPFGL